MASTAKQARCPRARTACSITAWQASASAGDGGLPPLHTAPHRGSIRSRYCLSDKYYTVHATVYDTFLTMMELLCIAKEKHPPHQDMTGVALKLALSPSLSPDKRILEIALQI